MSAPKKAKPNSSHGSPFQLAFRRLLRNRAAVAGALIIVLMTLACVLLPILLGLDPNQPSHIASAKTKVIVKG